MGGEHGEDVPYERDGRQHVSSNGRSSPESLRKVEKHAKGWSLRFRLPGLIDNLCGLWV